jgi:hypothetical protein
MNESDTEINKKELNMAEGLQQALENCRESSPKQVTSLTSSTLENIVGRELDLFRATGQRGIVLNLLYQALLTIPPTSVEAERAFSASGLFLTKLLSRLSDETLCKVTMLRSYFQQNN